MPHEPPARLRRRGTLPEHTKGKAAMNTSPLLATYGTLRVGQRNWRRFLAGAQYRGTHWLDGYRMADGGGFPYAAPDPASRILVDLFAIDDTTLRTCDALEGHPHHYTRHEVTVAGCRAWLYTVDAIDELPPIRHGDWRRHAEAFIPESRARRFYFAYGSNMDAAQMDRRCRAHRHIGVGVLSDHAFQINRRGVATIVPATGETVEGVVWSVSAADIAALDRWEGTDEGIYLRHAAPVRVAALDQVLPMVVYTAADTACGTTCRPGYAERVLAGARRGGLSAAYLDRLAACLERANALVG
ncbi:gamma-glutamylcyclotransferase [Roseomonas genomospecies 6]|uniref:Gamma-glutamylcyclotransferase n=1 Tax=Roseomonas genomospecies 6 TaxID=214106 RepID=A0A9W7NE93_9PROT|nr:gamma-glutamylcyclotransferase [Roseomonas genomospecies 6]KAA0676996.1 gamma-glutamylcyclotransferase [Roseomonas genomospecies 6]